MANVTLGKVAPTPKGEWNGALEYEKLDIVTNSTTHKVYMAIQNVPANTAITNNEYWEILGIQSSDAEIDDTAGDGDINKVWSADKSYDEITNLKNSTDNLKSAVAPISISKSFSVAPNGTHLSSDDQIKFQVYKSEFIRIDFDISIAEFSVQLFARNDNTSQKIYESSSTEPIIIEATNDYNTFGLYLNNRTAGTADVTFTITRNNVASLNLYHELFPQVNANSNISYTISGSDTILYLYDNLLIKAVSNNVTKTQTDIITELGERALAFGSKGVSIRLQNNEALAFNRADNTLLIKPYQRIGVANEIPLLIVQYGGICGGLLYPIIINNLTASYQHIFAYISDNKGISFSNGGSGKTIVTLYSGLNVHNIITNSTSGFNQARILEDLGQYAVAYGTIGVNVTMNSNHALVYDLPDDKLKLVNRISNINKQQIPLLIAQYGGICGGLLYPKYQEYIYSNIKDNMFYLTDGSLPENYEADSKVNKYSQLFIDAEETESYLYFTDPHTLAHNYDEIKMRQGIDAIEYSFNKTPTTYCICGGDWLTSSDSKTESLEKLGYIDGFMRKKFGDYYLPVLGNHDTNYQGVDQEGGEANSGRLPQSSIEQIWFRKYRNIYYTYKGINSRFYIFDTGIDWTTSMDDYRWAQIDWFASELINNDDKHSIIFLHIFTNSSKANLEADVNASAVPFSQNIFEVAQKYNSKTTLTLNNKTYNFSNTTGKIAFAQCGHSHYDSIVTYKDIPVVITINATYVSRFDLCYVDYTNSIYKMIRVGQDDTFDREVNIIV